MISEFCIQASKWLTPWATLIPSIKTGYPARAWVCRLCIGSSRDTFPRSLNGSHIPHHAARPLSSLIPPGRGPALIFPSHTPCRHSDSDHARVGGNCRHVQTTERTVPLTRPSHPPCPSLPLLQPASPSRFSPFTPVYPNAPTSSTQPAYSSPQSPRPKTPRPISHTPCKS